VSRAITLLALLAIITLAAFMVSLVGLAFGWSLLGLAALTAVAAVLFASGYSRARGLLLIIAIVWVALPIPVLITAVLLAVGGDPLPSWVPAWIAAAIIAGFASVIALVTGMRHIQRM
jgi:hypothetical protein